jgi:YrbI family 3-deoxy-D-manno-octulosonate 8-phosphate phosphatase
MDGMVKKLEVLAIIPARAGSKSIAKKNVRFFAGHPLLAYSIAAGLQAKRVSRVMVSTDDKEFSDIARSYGAEVPFLRPAELAADDVTDLPVFEHALHWLIENEDYRPDLVVQLRPTSPIRPRDCVDRALEILINNPQADSVRGVVPSGQNPYKMWRFSDDGSLEPLLQDAGSESYNMPRQELPATYWQTGHIDAIRTETILEKKSMSGEVILPLLLDARYTVDIDTLEDWRRAEYTLLRSDLDPVLPGRERRSFPQSVSMVILDFDGVLTDNRVWVDGAGNEWVAANRGDGWGIARLKERGIEVVVLSTESNPVVTARCRKLGIAVKQNLADKVSALKELFKESGVDPSETIFLGNDVNDVSCFPLVACALVVSDAHPQARSEADMVLQNPGGHGAVRELCDLVIRQMDEVS